MRWNKSFEGTLHIYDADLQKMAKMLGDVNIKECPYFDLSDRYGNSARYYREDQWIPCSERLPSEQDYKACYEAPNGTVWYCTSEGLIGLGWYYESTWEWANLNNEAIVGDVIAWMPLPDPYKENKE